jgi:protein involved in polysaccharide export with SLBB domain
LKLGHGDIVRVFSAVDIALSTQRQSKRVRIEGEVHRPGEYVLPENSSVADLIRLAGGVTPAAFVFATDFTRVSVQMTQQQNYERALRDLETELARNASSTRVTSPEEASTMSVNRMAATQLVERMRALRPTGRIVLQLEPDGRDLPDLALEDGDRIYIPTKPSTVGVFGSVFNAATYLHSPGRKVSDYVRLAGGPTRGADDRAAFIVRANGTVISELQRTTGWFASGASVGDVIAQPGDTVFIPEEIGRTTLVQNLKDWTQILSQFGLGVAAVKILGN